MNELNKSAGVPLPGPAYSTSEQLQDFQANPTLAFAGDLLSAAIVSRDSNAIQIASEFISSSDPNRNSSLVQLVRRLDLASHSIMLAASANPNEEFERDLATDQENQVAIWQAIHDLKSHVRNFPWNPIAWTDLARHYANRGLNDQANKAAIAALTLAPNNRFVLRSVARFLVHIRDIEKAHDIVAHAPNLSNDPWLSAAEISLALSAKRSPRSTRAAGQLINSGDFSDFDLSELNSALATVEFRAGKNQKAKKLMRSSLLSANENSFAQVKWIAGELSLRDDYLEKQQIGNIARPYEATAFEMYKKRKWADALYSAIQWMNDQPFSTAPAQMAGFISAAMLEDYDAAIKIGEEARRANPHVPSVNNNLIFSYASSGKLDQALRALDRLRPLPKSQSDMVTYQANHGLIAFRQGDIDEGRAYYSKAVEQAEGLPEKRTLGFALLFWAREETIAGTEMAPSILELASKLVPKGDPGMETLLENVLNQRRRSQHLLPPIQKIDLRKPEGKT